MTTELTLREKVLDVMGLYGSDWGKMDADYIVNAIADLLSATGAPAYCRVADDLRGVVREEGELHQATNGKFFLGAISGRELPFHGDDAWGQKR